MESLKRAFKYVTRKKTKSILLMITFFLIGNLVIFGMGVSKAADNAKIAIRHAMDPIVVYRQDYEAFDEFKEDMGNQLTSEEYSKYVRLDTDLGYKIAKDPRVKTINAIKSEKCLAQNFKFCKIHDDDEQRTSKVIDENGEEIPYVEPNIYMVGNVVPTMIEIEDGTFSILEGRFYTQEEIDEEKHVCLVTKELQNLNDFELGDKIKIQDESVLWHLSYYREHGYDFTEEDMELEYEIIGIYESNIKDDPNSPHFMFLEPYQSVMNKVLAPATAIQFLNKEMQDAAFEIAVKEGFAKEEDRRDDAFKFIPWNFVYLLNDPYEVDSFVNDYVDELGPFKVLDAHNEELVKMSRPLDTLSFFSNLVIWIVTINAIVIIALVTAITLKTRQYEMGVLISLGVSKFKVIVQLFLEIILVGAVGFGLACISGTMLAGQVGDAVMDYQTTRQKEYVDDEEDDAFFGQTIYEFDAYFTEVNEEDLIEQYKVRISPALIGEIYLLGVGVVLLAIVVPGVMIMRYNPKEILLEQN